MITWGEAFLRAFLLVTPIVLYGMLMEHIEKRRGHGK